MPVPLMRPRMSIAPLRTHVSGMMGDGRCVFFLFNLSSAISSAHSRTPTATQPSFATRPFANVHPEEEFQKSSENLAITLSSPRFPKRRFSCQIGVENHIFNYSILSHFAREEKGVRTQKRLPPIGLLIGIPGAMPPGIPCMLGMPGMLLGIGPPPATLLAQYGQKVQRNSSRRSHL